MSMNELKDVKCAWRSGEGQQCLHREQAPGFYLSAFTKAKRMYSHAEAKVRHPCNVGRTGGSSDHIRDRWQPVILCSVMTQQSWIQRHSIHALLELSEACEVFCVA